MYLDKNSSCSHLLPHLHISFRYYPFKHHLQRNLQGLSHGVFSEKLKLLTIGVLFDQLVVICHKTRTEEKNHPPYISLFDVHRGDAGNLIKHIKLNIPNRKETNIIENDCQQPSLNVHRTGGWNLKMAAVETFFFITVGFGCKKVLIGF